MTSSASAPELRPSHWSSGACDAWDNVLEERPDLSGAEYAALEQAVELISATDVLDAAARESGHFSKAPRANS